MCHIGKIQEVTFCSPLPPTKMAKNDIFFETRRMGRKRKKNPLLFFFFSKFSFFRCFFSLFLFFFGCFRARFAATLLEIARQVCYKKDRESKNIGHVVFCFSIFQAVWRSRNLERVYIFSTKAVLRPPCRR